jgi:hypothetical protein
MAYTRFKLVSLQSLRSLFSCDEFLVEDTNLTKLRLGNLTTGSFVFGNTDTEVNQLQVSKFYTHIVTVKTC